MGAGEKEKEKDKYATLHLLAKRILAGSLVILFIGVCSFTILFIAVLLAAK